MSSGGAVAQSERSSDRPPVGTSPSALNIVVCLERKGLGDDLIVEGGSELRPGRSIVIVGARGVKGTGHYLRVVSGDVSERHCRVRLKSVSLQFAFLLTPLNHLSISPSLHISLSLSLSLSMLSYTPLLSLRCRRLQVRLSADGLTCTLTDLRSRLGTFVHPSGAKLVKGGKVKYRKGGPGLRFGLGGVVDFTMRWSTASAEAISVS